MAIQDEIKEQKKKFKTMTAKEKWSYFYTYYKIPVAAAVLLFLFLFFFIKDLVTGNQESVLNVVLINSEAPYMEDTAAEKFQEYLALDSKKEKVVFDNTYQLSPEGMDQMSVASTQKLVANVQAELMDVMIAPEEIISTYVKNGFFCDLHDILTEEQYTSYEKQNLIYTGKTENGEEIPVGIYLRKNRWLQENQLFTKEEPVLACLFNTPHQDTILKFLSYLQIEENS